MDDGDLACPALIGVAGDAAAGDQLGRFDRVHRAAPEALDPDGGDRSGHAV